MNNYYLYYTVSNNKIEINNLTVILPEGRYKLRNLTPHIDALMKKHNGDFIRDQTGYGVIHFKNNKVITKTFMKNEHQN